MYFQVLDFMWWSHQVEGLVSETVNVDDFRANNIASLKAYRYRALCKAVSNFQSISCDWVVWIEHWGLNVRMHYWCTSVPSCCDYFIILGSTQKCICAMKVSLERGHGFSGTLNVRLQPTWQPYLDFIWLLIDAICKNDVFANRSKIDVRTN